jgi:hypothetical protein
MTRQELQEELEHQAERRRIKADEYADDTRNIEAAEIFDRLAATVADIKSYQFDALLVFDDTSDVELWNEMLRRVGFSLWPETAGEFVRRYAAEREDAAYGTPGANR